jgi:mannose-6-phosphate isomerase-like protein (cupin superfamily)
MTSTWPHLASTGQNDGHRNIKSRAPATHYDGGVDQQELADTAGTSGIEEYRSTTGAVLALVVRSTARATGIEFFTPPESSQQLGIMRHEAGHRVLPHIHNVVAREVHRTQEVLLVREGSCELDLYGENREFVASLVLSLGDVVLLASGGHGLRMLEECELLEVKQGPYLGVDDKVRFEGRAEP